MKILMLFVGWCVLLALSWPLALVSVLLLPLVLLVWLPLKLVWMVMHATFALLQAVLMLPARLLGYRSP